MYTIEHLELLLLLIVSINFQVVSVLQATEVPYSIKFLCNRRPEVMKLKFFHTPCWLVAELS